MELLDISLCLLLMFIGVEAQSDKQMYCSVCRVMIDEINWSISQVDPKKTLKTGSFRVDPKGNQAIKTVPYARSETHLTEVIEEVCQRMNHYAETTDDEGKRSIVRTSSRNGKPLHLKNIKINKEIQKQLAFYCDTIIEEHEEALIGLFKRESAPDLEKVICGHIAKACNEAELNTPLATLKAEEEPEDDTEDEEEDEEEGEKKPKEEPTGEPKKEDTEEAIQEEKPKQEL